MPTAYTPLAITKQKEKNMQNRRTLVALAASTLLYASSFAGEVEVKITNLTKGIYFTPLLVAAHPASAQLYKAGEAASLSVQKMAEGGDISGISSDLGAVSASVAENPASGLLAPGASATATIISDESNNRLSVVAMMLPTNDGFIALNNAKIPTTPGTYSYELNAHDAGTEANNEIINGGGAPGVPGLPAAPDGTGGTGATGIEATEEGYVHIHRGNIGDMNATAGKSDINTLTHRWLNPVANVVITVK